MTEISKEEMARRLRENLLDVLQLWSSKEEQLKYQENVPIAQVSSELFGQWETFYEPESSQFKSAFNEIESKILAEFNMLIQHVLEKLTNIPVIEEFIITNEWIIINKAAINTQERLQKSRKIESN